MSPTRREMLRAVASVPAVSLPRVPAWEATTETRVMTRNLGLGTGLFGLLSADDLDPERVHAKYREVVDSGVSTRMRAIAGEIARERPAVVGLQEAALVARGPADGDPTETRADFLAAVQAGLDEQDAPYRLAVTGSNADVVLPARPPEGDPFTVRLLDRDALLVRADVDVIDTASAAYEINAQTTVGERTLTATRGYCRADCLLDGVPLTAVSTHLASSSALVRRAQAVELVEAVGGEDGALVLLGDFNSGPNAPEPSAYATLSGPFTDAWAVADAPGPTCCQLPTLHNANSRLDRRIDAAFVGGPVEPVGASRTGGTPAARVEVGGRRLWPSDHAGVVADLRLAPPLEDPRAVVRALL